MINVNPANNSIPPSIDLNPVADSRSPTVRKISSVFNKIKNVIEWIGQHTRVDHVDRRDLGPEEQKRYDEYQDELDKEVEERREKEREACYIEDGRDVRDTDG